jgi:hypothetical protein
MVASRRAEMSEAGFRHYLQMQARHTRHLAALNAAQARRKAAEAGENTAAFALLRARAGGPPDSEPLHLLLPSGPRRASVLGAQRRARYRQHLQAVIAEALTDGPPAPASAPTPARAQHEQMLGQVCALCAGGCCTKGGEQAYLSADTIRRFMLARPELSPDAVLHAYLERLSDKTQAGSCINHTRQGCSLPKEMRSDICNRFSCESLARLQAAQRAPQALPVVLIVRRKQDHWRRAEPGLDNAVNALAVLGAAGLRRVPRRPAPDQPTAATMSA